MKLGKLLLLILFSLISAETRAQPKEMFAELSDAGIPESASIVYFLVDVSGSVPRIGSAGTDPLLLVKDILAQEFEALPDGTWKSVTFFGRKPEGNEAFTGCDEPINLGIALAPEAGIPQFPSQGGDKEYTAIGKALKVVLHSARSNSSIVLISDGDEECGADFVAIRKEFPNAAIRVVGLPLQSKIPLQLLEVQPRTDEAEDRSERLQQDVNSWFNFSNISIGTQKALYGAWSDANWFEKYLWALSYLLMAFSAGMFGHRYNKIVADIEIKIEEWLSYLRSQATPNSNMDPPTELNLKALESEQAHWKARSIGLLIIAIPIAVVLAFSDGVPQLWTQWTLSVFCGIAIVWLVYEWFQKKFSQGDTTVELWLPQSVRWRLSLIIALATVVTLAWTCIDLEKARSAAWFALSSNFSTALALIASGPFLFLGARWIESTRAYATYLNVESQSLSAKAQELREAARKLKAERERLEGAFRRMSFQYAEWVQASEWGSRFLGSVTLSMRKRDGILKLVKQSVLEAVPKDLDQEARDLFQRLIDAGSNGLAAFLREVKTLSHTTAEAGEAMEQLAQAIERGDKRIIQIKTDELYGVLIRTVGPEGKTKL